MADVGGLLASAVVSAACDKLVSAVGDQVTMLCSFKDDMEDMKETLESMAAVLKDAERRSVREESVRLWLKRLKNAAHDISDMLDEFQPNTKPASGKMTGMLFCLSIAPKITMANKMKKIRDQLSKIKVDHESFGFTHDTGLNNVHQFPDPRETTSKVIESLIIGRGKERKKVLSLLSTSNNQEDTIFVAIYGIGGIGKTTLAQLVFNDAQFKDYDHRIWVYVSQVFDLKKIGNSIISQVMKEGNQNADTRELINQRLQDLLQDKKILIVLDDLWETNNSQLKELKLMLNVSHKMKVLVTTRNEEIARSICTGKLYKLDPLENDMCWTIIKKNSDFESRAGKEQFEQVGKDIAKKCGGVPLAAQALGFLLSEMNLTEWNAVCNSDIWDESSSNNTVLPSLMLSYKIMAPCLRLCFAYCAIFPKGHNISKDNLIHQWIALDFIEPSNTFSAIQLGEKYVRQLLGMSFLQHSKLPTVSQKQAVYTMHDLVHDLARSVIDEELIVFDAKKERNIRKKYCRYALLANYSGPTKIPTILEAKLRALHFLDCSKLELNGGAFSFAKCLRVLDLTECSIREFPNSIGQLKQMRFLIAPELQVQIFPKSITQLPKLQYLDLHGSSRISKLPSSISKVECLMHLNLSGCSSVKVIPEALCDLTKLQYLDLSDCSRLGMLPDAIGSLAELQYLNLSGCRLIKVLPESFRELRSLVHLDMANCSIEEGLGEALWCLTKLQYLNLSGTLDRIHSLEFIRFLINLEHLDLSMNRYIYSLPESLGNLKKLHTLDLSHCFNLDTLPESIGSIDSLEFISVKGCANNLQEYMRNFLLKKNRVLLPQFVVHTGDDDSCSNLHLLENLNPTELEVSCLENVRSVEEARGIELSEKQNLSELTFNWTLYANRLSEDKDVLEVLVPPRGLQDLKLRGYGSTCFPTWLMGIDQHLPNLVKIVLENLRWCRHLPPLGQLPNLEELHLKRLHSITKIDGDFCGGKGAFRRLSMFTLDWMLQLEEWNTTYICEDGMQEFMFPVLNGLSIYYCHRLRLKPRPPIFQKWIIHESDKVMSSWGERDHVTHSFSSTSSTRLEIRSISVSTSDKLRLLHHLPTLQELSLYYCLNLTSLPDIVRHLASLRSLELAYCPISGLPEWLGDLTSLQVLDIEECWGITDLPPSIQQLTNLQKVHIVYNHPLQRWCESEKKRTLAHVKDIVCEWWRS